jgi:membrane protein implicated in regulation of membrane protease activity
MAVSEKLLAGLVAAAVIAPACAVCVLGPVFLGSAVAWVAGWISGLDILVAAGLAIITGGVLYKLLRRRRVKAESADKVGVPASRIAKIGPQ